MKALDKKISDFVQQKAKDAEKISQETMMATLDWAYKTVVSGEAGKDSLMTLVEDYTSKYDSERAIDELIKVQTTKATVSGFLTGFGGFVTLPVTVPANIASVILFQMRMIAAIATIRGYNVKSDQVQTFVYATLAGTSVAEIVKKSGIVIGNKLGVNLVKKVPGKVLIKINQRVGFRLATKFGSTGVVNLGKMIPVIGAVVGGSFDAGTTLAIAKLAKSTFSDDGLKVSDEIVISKDSIKEL